MLKPMIQVKSNGGFVSLLDLMSRRQPSIAVGVRGSFAEVAAVHEYGTRDGTVPARSYLRSTLIDRRSAILDEFAAIARGVLRGDREMRMIDQLGPKLVGWVRDRILGTNIPPPLKPRTVQRKGHAHALTGAHGSGQLVDAIDWWVIS